MSEQPNAKRPRANVRRPDIMQLVSEDVAGHFHSPMVENLQKQGGKLTVENTTILLAKQFGFCYGVQRAIDLAYASRRVFPEQRIYLIGEIIHNPDVNRHLQEMNITSLPWSEVIAYSSQLTNDDVVIVPAFGAPMDIMKTIEAKGCHIVDTTCGDVMKVWRRVQNFAKNGITSIIHGKADHEETRATASRALGEKSRGNYLIVLTLKDIDYLCHYINYGGDKAGFLKHFSGCYSPGFDPDAHLQKIGVANQTTMLKNETEEIQGHIRKAIIQRDGNEQNFYVFDTICGATQERQDALFQMLKEPMDLLFVVGGYNSSNTTHLVEIAEKNIPTFFIQAASCIHALDQIVHYDIQKKEEITSNYTALFSSQKTITIGITAGASCPNNLIEATILKILELRRGLLYAEN